MQRYWMEYKVEHLIYFSNRGLEILLEDHEFQQIRQDHLYKIFSLACVIDHFDRYTVPILTLTARFMRWITPATLLQRNLKLHGSGILVYGTKQ